jgi:hypothetical protein
MERKISKLELKGDKINEQASFKGISVSMDYGNEI